MIKQVSCTTPKLIRSPPTDPLVGEGSTGIYGTPSIPSSLLPHLRIEALDHSEDIQPEPIGKFDIALPADLPAAFQRVVDGRNSLLKLTKPMHKVDGKWRVLQLPDQAKRLYARDLYEEAIVDLLHKLKSERVTFMATPYRDFTRKEFWVAAKLKASVKQIAQVHNVTISAVVLTAFYHYLDRHSVADRMAS